MRSTLIAAALIFSLMISVRPGFAKWVDVSAHFEEESYWAAHAIYLARITEFKQPDSTNANPAVITSFTVINVISGTPRAQNGTIESRPKQVQVDGIGNGQPPGFPEGTSTGSELLMSDDLRYNQTTVVKVLKFPDDQALLVLLGKIANLRKSPTLRDLVTGATSDFELISEYCLKRLSTWPAEMIPGEDVKSLQALANDSGRPAESRIQAEEDALRFSVTSEANRNDAEYAWLRGVIEGLRHDKNTNADWQGNVDQERRLIYKLLSFKNDREATADHVVELAADRSATAILRGAACSALSGWDSEVFDFAKPDARFDRMVNVYLALMRDENPDLRIMGMSMLFDRTLTIMRDRSPAEATRQYTQKAVEALEHAVNVETNSRVKFFFQSRLTMHQTEERHPEYLEQVRQLESRAGLTNDH